VKKAMNQQHNITNLYDAQLSQQVDYCMNAAAAYYCQYLTPDDPHLFQRGISYATAQRFRVGRAQGKTNLLGYLSGIGIPFDIIAQAGLLNPKGNDLFQNHVVVPIYRGDQVVDFIGRYVGDNPAYPKYWRLSRD
jgi:DNA primase